MHSPKSFPSDILFICALEKPRSEIILNIAMNANEKEIIPRAAGAACPQSFAITKNPTIPIIRMMKFVDTIRKDFLAIINEDGNKKDVYK